MTGDSGKRWRARNPERAAYDDQRRAAKKRGIAWEFTFETWWAWWQIDDRWSRRGKRKGQLMMARYGDIGPYGPANVRPLTPKGNQDDIRPEVRAAGVEKVRAALQGENCYLFGQRGDDHPCSKAVYTPKGRFGSVLLAAEYYGLAPTSIRRRIKRGWPGWVFESAA